MTPWHLVAFLGELVLWGCAARAAWGLTAGPLRWVLAAAAFVAIVAAWSVWAAPRSPRRLPLASRLAFIGGLGLIVCALFLVALDWPGMAVAAGATLAVVLAQWRDGRRAPSAP